MKNKPNLFLVGAMKAGTTSLYRYLMQHEKIYFPNVKEPHYYALSGRNMIDRGPGDALRYKDLFVTNKSDYYNLYPRTNKYKYLGDASAMYLYFHESATRIKQDNNNSKIIITLRNPVDRAYSSYKHLVRDGRETKTFKEGLALEESRIKDDYLPIWYYVNAGLYSNQVKSFIDVFDKENVMIILYDKLQSQPDLVVREIFQFLGLDLCNEIDTSLIYNKSGIPKSRKLQSILNSSNGIKRSLVKLLPLKFKNKLRNRIFSLSHNEFPDMDRETRLSLINFFKNDIEQLEDIINMDLKSWYSE